MLTVSSSDNLNLFLSFFATLLIDAFAKYSSYLPLPLPLLLFKNDTNADQFNNNCNTEFI
jgi:hypothetical protein